MQLRPFALLAPGAALIATLYWLDYPPASSSVYPIHQWSTACVIVGWWLLLGALALIGRTQFIDLVAFLSALALGLVNGDNSTLTESLMPQAGVLGACLVLLLATSREIVTRYSWRGRVAWAIVLAAVGAGVIVLNSVDPSIPVVDSPAGEFLATLVAAPAFLGLKAAWRWRYGPPEKDWLVGCPWWGWVLLISFFWSVNIAVRPFRQLGAPEIVAYGAAVVVVVLAGAAAVVLAPKVQSWSRHWLEPNRPPVSPHQSPRARAAEKNPPSGPPNDQLEWDGNQFVPATQRGGSPPTPEPAQRREWSNDWPAFVLAGCVYAIFAGSLLLFAYILIELSWERARQGDFVASIVTFVMLAPVAILITAAVLRARRN